MNGFVENIENIVIDHLGLDEVNDVERAELFRIIENFTRRLREVVLMKGDLRKTRFEDPDLERFAESLLREVGEMGEKWRIDDLKNDKFETVNILLTHDGAQKMNRILQRVFPDNPEIKTRRLNGIYDISSLPPLKFRKTGGVFCFTFCKGDTETTFTIPEYFIVDVICPQ